MKEYAVKTYGEMYTSCILEETKLSKSYFFLNKLLIRCVYSVIVCTSTFHIDRSLVSFQNKRFVPFIRPFQKIVGNEKNAIGKPS
jgi:hypothetical protein